MRPSSILLLALAAAVVGADPIRLTPDEAVTGSVGLTKAVYYSLPVTEAVSHDGLVIEVEFGSGLLHLYARCGSLPTLKNYDQASLPQSLEEKEYEMYMSVISGCVGNTMYFLAYGYHNTPSYKLLAHFGGTIAIEPFEPTDGKVSRGGWQFYKLTVRNYAAMRITTKITSAYHQAGLYTYFQTGKLPSASKFENRVNVYKTPSVRCIDLTVPTQGAAYIGVQGELGNNVEFVVEVQPNLEPGTRCA